MVTITLSKGKTAVIDDEDYELVSRYNWYANECSPGFFYASATANKTVVRMHRLIMDAQPGEIIDHIDRDTLNNRRSNLRKVTHAENCQNSSRRVVNTYTFIKDEPE